MKRFLINFTEVSYGVVEVFAENEEQARELALDYEGDLMTTNSDLELGDVVLEEDIDNMY